MGKTLFYVQYCECKCSLDMEKNLRAAVRERYEDTMCTDGAIGGIVADMEYTIDRIKEKNPRSKRLRVNVRWYDEKHYISVSPEWKEHETHIVLFLIPIRKIHISSVETLETAIDDSLISELL